VPTRGPGLLNLVSLFGILVLAVLAWTLGGLRRPVPWRTAIGSASLMLALGVAVFLVEPSRRALVWLNDVVVALIGGSRAGAQFLFGPLALNRGETTAAGESSIGFVLAAQVLPAVIFFAALMAALYHLGWMQPVVRLLGRMFKNSLVLSGAEALAGAANVFVGIESAVTVRPYLAGMTRSELLTVLSCCMSTVASTTLALYVFFLQDAFPNIAGHLISASVLSIPAAVLVSKLMLPETGRPETLGDLPPMAEAARHGNTMSALAAGSWDGLRLAAGIATLLIAVLGIVGIVDLLLLKLTSPLASALGGPLSLERLLGWLLSPLTWLLGIETADLGEAARLLGKRILVTEVPAYRELGELGAAGAVSHRTLLILSYALCGFAHVASVGIFVGGIAALAPTRRDDLAALSLPALACSTLATLMTGAVAGLFYTGQRGVLGL
jgi:CNT family concentrative nucleoside transporter